MSDPKDAARELISIADHEMELKWQASPAVVGAGGYGLTIGNHYAGVAFVKVAGEWLAAANQVLGSFDPNDSDSVIDELGKRVDLVQQRRSRLFDMGMGTDEPLSEALTTFVNETVARIRALLEWLKQQGEKYGPPALALGVLIAIVVLGIALR